MNHQPVKGVRQWKAFAKALPLSRTRNMLYNWLQHIEFKNLWVLPLLLSLPVIAWFYYRTPSWRKSTFKVTTAESFKVRTAKNNLLHLPFWLRLSALACLILALARPQVKNVQNKTKGEGIDIVL